MKNGGVLAVVILVSILIVYYLTSRPTISRTGTTSGSQGTQRTAEFLELQKAINDMHKSFADVTRGLKGQLSQIRATIEDSVEEEPTQTASKNSKHEEEDQDEEELDESDKGTFADWDWVSAQVEKGRAENKQAQSADQRKERFQSVYDQGIWKHGNPDVPGSGSGSTVAITDRARKAIMTVVKKYKIKTIIDAPCGDLTWMRILFPAFEELGVKYIGVDIVPTLIAKHNNEFAGNEMVTFQHIDLSTQPLPQGDLVFSREALQHLNWPEVMLALHTFSVSGAKYLLTTNYDNENSNFNWVSGGDATLINLEQAPYNVEAPLERFPDGTHPSCRLVLWPLPLRHRS